MRHLDDHERKAPSERLRAAVALFTLGLGILGFLVAIDRPQWFHIRPFSGTAAAMSYASDQPMAAAVRR